MESAARRSDFERNLPFLGGVDRCQRIHCGTTGPLGALIG